jgi:tetratricopeptide (TPR) repeat protein
VGRAEKTLEIAAGYSFHPWEGDEGVVSRCYTNAHWLLGRKAFEEKDYQTALRHFQEATAVSENHIQQPFEGAFAHAVYYRGLTLGALGRGDEARKEFEWLIDPERIYERSVVTTHFGLRNHSPYYGLALIQLGRREEGVEALKHLKKLAEEAARGPFVTTYLRSGKPNPIFGDDNQRSQRLAQICLAGLAAAALGDQMEAKRLLGETLAEGPENLVAWEEYRRL